MMVALGVIGLERNAQTRIASRHECYFRAVHHSGTEAVRWRRDGNVR
jgi:hypothetical protein